MNRTRFASALAMAALAAILLPSFLHAQTTFQRTYGGAKVDAGYSVQQTTDGGYIISGTTYSYGAGYQDVYLIKTDDHGDTLWTATIGGADDEWGTAVLQTSDGGYATVGGAWSYPADTYKVYLVKTSAEGTTQWTRSYGGAFYQQGLSVQQTRDSGYIITGNTASFGAGLEDVYLIKTNEAGDTLWTRTFGGVSYDWGQSVRQTADGCFIIAGATCSYGAGNYDFYLLKTDVDGDTLWTRTYGGDTNDLGYSVQETADGGYIIVGYTESFGAGRSDVYVIKTNGEGDTLWTRTFGGKEDDKGISVQQTADNGYIIVGVTESYGAGKSDVYLVKTNADGDALWTRTFGGTEDDGGNSVQQTTDGGYIIAGADSSFSAGDFDVYLIKTDSLGNVGVAEPKTSPTRASTLSLTCEPNPCRGATRISLTPQASSSRPLTLRIYDAQGRVVRSLSSLLSSPSSLTWDGSDDLGQPLSSGAYFVRLNAGGEHATARVVLQR